MKSTPGSRPGTPVSAGHISDGRMDRLLRFHAHDLCEPAAPRPAFCVVARDIIGYISSTDAVVLDYACGEALSAAKVADACALLYLAEPAPGVRGRLIARFAPNTKIRVRSLEDFRKMNATSVDLAVMNSVAQYMTPAEFDHALAVIRRLLKPGGRLVVGDILRPEVGMARDVVALLRFCDPGLFEGCPGRAGLDGAVRLPAIARQGRPAALQRSRDGSKTGGGRIYRLARPFQHRPQSVADDVCGAASVRAGGLIRVNCR